MTEDDGAFAAVLAKSRRMCTCVNDASVVGTRAVSSQLGHTTAHDDEDHCVKSFDTEPVQSVTQGQELFGGVEEKRIRSFHGVNA